MSRQKFIHSADSKSLWNCTLSPGWTQEENEILRSAIMKYGLGAWSIILKAKVLPGKTAAQLNLQTQRMLGQQSLGGFMGIKLDASKVWEENNKKQGLEYKRKNGCLVNTGNNPTKEERHRQIEENRKKYGLQQEVIDSIVIPAKLPDEKLAMNLKSEKKSKLKRLKKMVQYMEEKYREKFGEIPILPDATGNGYKVGDGTKTTNVNGNKSTNKTNGKAPKTKKKGIKKGIKRDLEDGGSNSDTILHVDDSDDDAFYIDRDDDSDYESKKRKRTTKKKSSSGSSQEQRSQRNKKVKISDNDDD